MENGRKAKTLQIKMEKLSQKEIEALHRIFFEGFLAGYFKGEETSLLKKTGFWALKKTEQDKALKVSQKAFDEYLRVSGLEFVDC
jgi:hypothetical protein